MSNFTTDLVVMVADNDAELTIRSLLSRHEALGIRRISHNLIRHPQRDAGCRGKPEILLRGFSASHRHALVLFDHHGSGRDSEPFAKVEDETRELLARNGWNDRAEVVVLSPELEIWMWSDSPEVDRILGWQERRPPLRQWLLDEGLIAGTDSKPEDPKTAYHRAVREVRRAVSASHFKEMARAVSFRRCTDGSFQRFLQILRTWFPPENAQS